MVWVSTFTVLSSRATDNAVPKIPRIAYSGGTAPSGQPGRESGVAAATNSISIPSGSGNFKYRSLKRDNGSPRFSRSFQ